ncbi:MAG: pilus assembly PilX family protein [Gammaproteobacteria bacterium]
MMKLNILKQEGAVLFVGLMMLLVMSLIAVTSMQGAALEERMAGNTRDTLVALQTAEAALQAAETFLEVGTSNLIDFDADGTDGLYDNSDPELWQNVNWLANDSRSYSASDGYTKPNNVTSDPRYIIQHISETQVAPQLLVQGYGEGEAGKTIQLFRVTARGTGGNNNTEVVLQSVYGADW